MKLASTLLCTLGLIFVGSLTSCEDDSKPTESNDNEDQVKENIVKTSDEALKRHAEAMLRISGTETYSYKRYEAHLNADDSIDYIFTINLLDRAKNDAIENDRTAQMATFGYTGRYNFFFFMDGATKNITSQMLVPSSALAELEVSFENVTNPAYKDIIIDYRVGTSCFRDYYSVLKTIPVQISKADVFKNLGKSDQEVFVIKYEESPKTVAKNIVIYKGEAPTPNFSNPDSVYHFKPEITPTNEVVRTWYYNPVRGKYFTIKD